MKKKFRKLILFLLYFFLLSSCIGVKTIELKADIDSDGDGLSDFQETYKYYTNPSNPDTDGDGVLDGDWKERKQYTYTITAILRITHPYDIYSMNNDYQDVKIIDEKKDYIVCEIVLYPENSVKEGIRENNKWGFYAESFNQYLIKNNFSNWDHELKKDLLKELHKAGINPATLSDKDLVQKVSLWIQKNFKNVQHELPAAFFIQHDEQGNLYVNDKYRDIFNEKVKSKKEMTDKAVFNQLLLGKQMYYNRTRGGCTSYSILASTIYRSLGIPTRTIITTKIRTTEKYLQMVNKLKNPIMRNIFKNTNKTQGNHFLNEVYIGDRWIRIDYTEFGFGSIHIDRGIFFQHYTLNDISKIDMVKYFGEMVYSNDSGPFKNGELIQIVDISDMYGGYYSPKYPYGINPAALDTYFLFGAREFCKYAESTVLANVSKFKNIERGKSGSINYLKHEYFKEGNLIIISTDNEYMKLPVLVRNKITKKEYDGIKNIGYRVININKSIVLVVEQ